MRADHLSDPSGGLPRRRVPAASMTSLKEQVSVKFGGGLIWGFDKTISKLKYASEVWFNNYICTTITSIHLKNEFIRNN